MTTRKSAPNGAPCWADLWTSDVEGSRKFYSELFGWEAHEPDPEFGGYFMFTRKDAPAAGGMGDMGDMKANNTWKVYLSTDDIKSTISLAEAHGAKIMSPDMPVADMGRQTVMQDSLGADIGAWQPGSFHGFSVLEEDGTPCWFELMSKDFDKSVAFYKDVFHWQTKVMGDTDEFRYTVMVDPDSGKQLAGIMDGSKFMPEGQTSFWSIYWRADDIDACVTKAKNLGASVVQEPVDTPYGRMASLTDPAGAVFKLLKN